MSNPYLGHSQLWWAGNPSPYRLFPGNIKNLFPLRFCHLTKVLVTNTGRSLLPLIFRSLISWPLSVGYCHLLWLPSKLCLLSIHVPFFGKSTQIKPSSFVWKTAPFLLSGHVVSLAPVLDTEASLAHLMLDSETGMSCDQPDWDFTETLECSLSFRVAKLCRGKNSAAGVQVTHSWRACLRI